MNDSRDVRKQNKHIQAETKHFQQWHRASEKEKGDTSFKHTPLSFEASAALPEATPMVLHLPRVMRKIESKHHHYWRN